MNARVGRLRKAMAEKGVECLLVSQPENRRYLSGFTGSAGVLIITADHALLASDFRYYEQVRQQAPDFELVEITDSTQAALAAVLGRLGVNQVGFESQDLTVETYGQWRDAIGGVEWAPTSGMVERLRQIKDADEIAAIERAVRLADEAMSHIYDWLRPGMTEREVSWELEVYMRSHGAEKLSFTTIVGSGPNGAMSHAVTSDRPIQVGDPVVIDMGCVVDGYCSDLTRSFCLGKADDHYQAVWKCVLQAQLAAEGAIRAGLPGVEADAVARRLIYGAGYEGKFGHGLGHGVGLAIHEGPRASMTSKDTLEPGMIVTVEPGIYEPGWGGVRIEDMVVVTEDGCRVLTGVEKRMIV